uniref:Reverse transcriptase domain-containing protein n=1 Tax=Tanacetum cinerariifolium TaxID=118510 RepID=A0A6L2N3Q0_TANCI|nr:hypothetical protein [Tanacetum cinerariifolium]
MQTRSSSRLVSNPSNPTPSTNPNLKGRNRRRSKYRIKEFNLDELSPAVVTMADQRTMAQLLQAPTEGYEDAIVVPAITADNFELKHGLLTLVQNKQFFGHDKEDSHAHNCPKCGNLVDGHYCQGCALLRKKFKEDLFTYCIENGILQDSFEPSYDNTNAVNALREPFVVDQDPGKNSSQSPPRINNNCCDGCGDSLEDIFYHQCTCELCGRCAHYGYNYPPKVSVVSNPEPCHNQNVDELPQTLPSFDPSCYSEDGNSFTYDSKSNIVHDSPNVFNPPLQPSTFSYEFCGNDAYYGHDCSLQDRLTICYDDDDDEDYVIAVTPSLSIEESDNSLSMGKEHIDTIPATESDEFIKSSVESLFQIPSESEGIPHNMCDVPFHDNSPPLDVSKDQFKDFFDSNDESTSTDYDSFSIDNIEYVEASPPDSKLSSSEMMEIVISEVGGIDDDIILTIKDDILRKKLLNINLLIANIEALNDNPIPSSDLMTNTTTHSDSSLYDSFILDLSINLFPSADRSDFYEFADELTHIISPPEYDCFFFKNEPNSRDFTMDVVEDIFPTREPRVYNALPTHPTLQLNLDFILSSESLFAYVIWIFLPFLSYSVSPQNLLSLGNEDTIFYLGICSYHISSFFLDVSHRSGTFIKFKVLNESPMEFYFPLAPLWTNAFGVESGSRLASIRLSRLRLVGTRPGKGKVSYSRNKPVVAKVSTNTSTSNISPDVAELKDMVKALLLDKKVNYNQGNTSYRPPMMSNQIRPPGFPPVPNNQNVQINQRNNQNRFMQNQNRGNNFNQEPVYQPLVFQPPAYQAPAYQTPAPQTQGVLKEDFSAYVKANDFVMRNMQTQGQNMQNQLTNLTDLITKFVNSNSASTSSSGTLPSNTIANPRNATKDTMHPTNNESTKDVQPPMVQTNTLIIQTSEPVNSSISEPVISLVNAPKPNPKSLIPYPSRRNDERNREKANNQIEKFYQIFKDMSFEISFVDALILMPKFASTLKALIRNKEKLSKMDRTPLNEHCSMVLLKKLPKKLGDPGKFLIPCDFPGMAECLALADLGASINLMPFSVWKRLSLPNLTPTCMALELANRLISHSVGVAEDVYVKVGSFYFPANFVVVDFDAEPRVPLILRRSFLKTGTALIDVFEGELTLHVSKEAITFNLDQTSRYSANYSDMTAKRIDVIDMACEEYSQEVLGFSDVIEYGNPTAYYDPIVSTTSLILTSFENNDFLLEEVDAFLKDDPTLPNVDQSYFDSEGDIMLLEAFLNNDPSPPP